MPSAKYAPVTREVAPGPARSFWMRIFPFADPKPPATQSSSASRSTLAWCDAKCHVERERFCTETYSTFAAWPTTISTAAFVYPARSEADDAYSSMTVKRLSGSATTSSRQKTAPPSTAFVTRT